MFGIGMGELLIILAVALLVLGPKRLPEVASGLGKAIREFRKATRDITSQLEVDESVSKPFKDIQSALRDEPAPAKLAAAGEPVAVPVPVPQAVAGEPQPVAVAQPLSVPQPVAVAHPVSVTQPLPMALPQPVAAAPHSADTAPAAPLSSNKA